MGYYSQFPKAIPHLKVGCVRVTHPCATRQPEQALLLPFDLHVLSLPLAFILSQDQTLHSKFFIYNPPKGTDKSKLIGEKFKSCHGTKLASQ